MFTLQCTPVQKVQGFMEERLLEDIFQKKNLHIASGVVKIFFTASRQQSVLSVVGGNDPLSVKIANVLHS
jgi:hypothetical protein